MRVMIVEDDAETRALLSRALSRDGHAVAEAASVAQALELASERECDLVVLDLGLPDGEGTTLCAELRRRGHGAPVLVLTAHGAVSSRLACFDAGADDFLAKPFAVAELRARVRALGRRGALPRGLSRRVGDVELDVTARRATRGGEALPITAREWAVIELLAAREEGGAAGRDPRHRVGRRLGARGGEPRRDRGAHPAKARRRGAAHRAG
ncbi:MAG: response regulator transcription factor [Polyangiales bacterium]